MGDLLEDVRAVLLDLDGTVWFGDEPAPGAAEAVAGLRRLGKRVAFVTNNSAASRARIRRKLWAMGIGCGEGEMVTSGRAAALLAARLGARRAHVCGTRDLAGELLAEGVEVVAGGSADCVVIGHDPALDYGRLAGAVRAAMEAEAVIACNRERSYPGPGGAPLPGCGAAVAAVEWCSGREADYVAGKPEPLLLEMACGALGLSAGEVLMVGDTYESDIAMADAFGCRSVLVGSLREGVTCLPGVADLIGELSGGSSV